MRASVIHILDLSIHIFQNQHKRHNLYVSPCHLDSKQLMLSAVSNQWRVARSWTKMSRRRAGPQGRRIMMDWKRNAESCRALRAAGSSLWAVCGWHVRVCKQLCRTHVLKLSIALWHPSAVWELYLCFLWAVMNVCLHLVPYGSGSSTQQWCIDQLLQQSLSQIASGSVFFDPHELLSFTVCVCVCRMDNVKPVVSWSMAWGHKILSAKGDSLIYDETPTMFKHIIND